ncbi:MAG: Skp family chaperone for outer membrane protein [Paracoccaceae bacterium]
MRSGLVGLVAAIAIGVCASVPCGVVHAQDRLQTGTPVGQITGILILNQERFFSDSQYGEQAQSEFDAASAELARENRQIERDLIEEEQHLVELRTQMVAIDFRVLADEFDTRVEAIRSAQDTKVRSLTSLVEQVRQSYFEQAFPVLLEIVRDRGAAVIMDTRSVILSAETVDITDDAIAMVDALLGNGPEEGFFQQPRSSAPLPRPEAVLQDPAPE